MWIRPSLTSAKHGLGLVTPGSIKIVYYIGLDNSLLLDLNYMVGSWHCEPGEVELVEPFKVMIFLIMTDLLLKPNFFVCNVYLWF